MLSKWSFWLHSFFLVQTIISSTYVKLPWFLDQDMMEAGILEISRHASEGNALNKKMEDMLTGFEEVCNKMKY